MLYSKKFLNRLINHTNSHTQKLRVNKHKFFKSLHACKKKEIPKTRILKFLKV
jgi:hypothetical protein